MIPTHQTRTLFKSELLRVLDYRCSGEDGRSSQEEYATAHEIILPRAGAFLHCEVLALSANGPVLVEACEHVAAVLPASEDDQIARRVVVGGAGLQAAGAHRRPHHHRRADDAVLDHAGAGGAVRGPLRRAGAGRGDLRVGDGRARGHRRVSPALSPRG